VRYSGPPVITVAIDTEEDNWGAYQETRPTTRNISHLIELQELFDRWGARPTYFVNRPPLISGEALAVLGTLAERDDVEIGGHCHPWNTPPMSAGNVATMMCNLGFEQNQAKIRDITTRITSELGTRPTTFRSGRWGMGPTVARALAAEGYRIDCSVTPLLDWTATGGPDFSNAPRQPYRFEPADPLTPVPDGSMIEMPATIGFLRGDQQKMAALRHALTRTVLRHSKVLGLLDRAGILCRRPLSPEGASADEMIRLTNRLADASQPVIGITFHSCTLLPGATPYVRSDAERAAFLSRLSLVLDHCRSAGYTFMTMREAAATVL
jgi:hypothetical protein